MRGAKLPRDMVGGTSRSQTFPSFRIAIRLAGHDQQCFDRGIQKVTSPMCSNPRFRLCPRPRATPPKVLAEAVWTLLALAKISKKAALKIEELNVVGRLVKLGRDHPEASDLREACFRCVCLVFKVRGCLKLLDSHPTRPGTLITWQTVGNWRRSGQTLPPERPGVTRFSFYQSHSLNSEPIYLFDTSEGILLQLTKPKVVTL